MCMAAILWSGIGTVVFGSSIRFLQQQGWKQIDSRRRGGSPESGMDLCDHRRRARTGVQCSFRGLAG